jgi:hypothetical protein
MNSAFRTAGDGIRLVQTKWKLTLLAPAHRTRGIFKLPGYICGCVLHGLCRYITLGDGSGVSIRHAHLIDDESFLFCGLLKPSGFREKASRIRFEIARDQRRAKLKSVSAAERMGFEQANDCAM